MLNPVWLRKATSEIMRIIKNHSTGSWKPRRLIWFLACAAFLNAILLSQTETTPKRTAAVTGQSTRYLPSRFPGRAAAYYSAVWGVRGLSVKAVESGELVRFTYQVLSADKAATLNEKKNEAFLIAPDIGLKLSVPSLEKVGQLRQSSTPEAGRSYWMAFSNPGRRVKRGDRVNVTIGSFHADGLVVE